MTANKEHTSVWLIIPQTNLHVGNESIVNFSVIDKAIQRDVTTGIPCINSSSLKGAIKEYFEGDLGVRLLAKKYNLPSKNYITNWINKFKKEGKIPEDISRDKTKTSSKKSIHSAKTEYEKQLEKKVYELEAKLAVFKKYEEILNKDKNKKK